MEDAKGFEERFPFYVYGGMVSLLVFFYPFSLGMTLDEKGEIGVVGLETEKYQ